MIASTARPQATCAPDGQAAPKTKERLRDQRISKVLLAEFSRQSTSSELFRV
jgi:hypothetical protein